MKLRNKKTGKVVKLNVHWIDGKNYESLAEVNSEWEDVPEEPKEHWFIDYDGGIIPFNRNKERATDILMKQIGNYFETKEEAEKAVERLRAWKRLKDKGFRFFGVHGMSYAIDFEINPPYTHITFDEYTATEEQKEFYNDLMLLFGGEE